MSRTVFTALAALVLAAGLSACSNGTTAQPSGSVHPTTGIAAPPSDTAHKSTGDKALVTNADGTPLLDLTVDKFHDATCDKPTQAVNGRFVAVNLTVHTYGPQEALTNVDLNQGWRYTDEGKVLPANTPAATQCHDERWQLAANHSYQATVVLDVPADDTSSDQVSFDVSGTHWVWDLNS